MTPSSRPLLTSLLAFATTAALVGQSSESWKNDWNVLPGMRLEINTAGYHLPTSIAFVPSPGEDPKDPLYFVNELRGTIKVITNDHSIYVFAKDFFELTVIEELPGMKGEVGLVGLCLAPEQGYVFVSFNYSDTNGILRNDIARFDSEPGTFSLKPHGMKRFSAIFDDHPSAISHFIGAMAIKDGALYVAVGDADTPALSRDIDSPCGKILRMSFDGEPLPDNPFYVDDDIETPRNFVWASGIRNTFALAFGGDQLCAGDNGPGVDRFLTIRKGHDYLYDGSDWSMGTNSDVVFGPAVAPVQMTFVPRDSKLVPEGFGSRFYFAASGFVGQRPGPGLHGEKSVLTVPYDIANGRVTGVPSPMLEYVGSGRQMPVGLAMGPDGLYVAVLFPIDERGSVIFKLAYDPARAHVNQIGRSYIPLMSSRGCFGCHGVDVHSETIAPTLERDSLIARLRKRLFTDEYLAQLDRVDEINEEPYVSYREARQEIRAAQSMDRIRTWMKYQIMEPRFDNPFTQMPNTGISEEHAVTIANGLLSAESTSSFGLIDQFRWFMIDLFPRPRLRHFGLFYGLGVLSAVLALWLSFRWRRRPGLKSSSS